MYLKPLHKNDIFLYNNEKVRIYSAPTFDYWIVIVTTVDNDNNNLKFIWWPKFICKAKKI